MFYIFFVSKIQLYLIIFAVKTICCLNIIIVLYFLCVKDLVVCYYICGFLYQDWKLDWTYLCHIQVNELPFLCWDPKVSWLEKEVSKYQIDKACPYNIISLQHCIPTTLYPYDMVSLQIISCQAISLILYKWILSLLFKKLYMSMFWQSLWLW